MTVIAIPKNPNTFNPINTTTRQFTRTRVRNLKADAYTLKKEIRDKIPQQISVNLDADKLASIQSEIHAIIDKLTNILSEATDIKDNAYCGITAGKAFAGVMIVLIFVEIAGSLIISIINKAVNDPNSNCIADWASWTKMAIEIIMAGTAGAQSIAAIVHECLGAQAEVNDVVRKNGLVLKEANKLLKLASDSRELMLAQKDSDKQKLLKECVSTATLLSPEVKDSLAPEKFIPTLARQHLPPDSTIVETMNKINDLSLQLSDTGKKVTPKEGPKSTGEESVVTPEDTPKKQFTVVTDKATLRENLNQAFTTINAEFQKLGWDADDPFTRILCGDHLVSSLGTRTKLEKPVTPPTYFTRGIE